MSTALRIVHGTFGRIALLDMDRSLVRHAHPHCHVLIKVDGADTQFAVLDRIVALTDMQAVLINMWEPHAYVHYHERPRTTILALYIEPDWLRTFRPNWVASGAQGFFDRPAGELSPRIRRLSMDLATMLLTEPCARAQQEQLLSDLMISVIERFTPWRSLSPRIANIACSQHRFDWRIRRAIKLIHVEPTLVHNINMLAKESGLSRAHFYRLFERASRMTPRIYLNLLRMESAISSIINSADNLAVVSHNLGFSAPSHFTRFFREHAGVSPRQFRDAARISSSELSIPQK